MKLDMKKILIAGIIVCGAGFYVLRGSAGSSEVRVYALGKEDVNENFLFEGIVAPGAVIPVYMEADGIIEKIYLGDGSHVQPGDEILTFRDESTLELRKQMKDLELDMANKKLQLDDLESGSLKLEVENREFEIKRAEEEITRLSRGITVIKFEAETLRQQAQAKMKLLSEDGISSVDVNQSITMANRAERDYEDTKTNLNLANQRYELMVLSLDRLKRELNIKMNILNGEYEKLELQKNTLERKIAQISQPLKAASEGIITELQLKDGELAKEGTRLLGIVPPGSRKVMLQISSGQAPWLQRGQKAVVKNQAENREYEGVVARVSQTAKEDKRDRVVEVEIDILNPDAGLRPGFSTSVEVIGNSMNNLVAADSFSVVEENGNSYVYTVTDNQVQKTLVEVGAKTSSKVEILNLPLGTEIVVNPFKVRNGQKVKVVK